MRQGTPSQSDPIGPDLNEITFKFITSYLGPVKMPLEPKGAPAHRDLNPR